MGAPIDTDHPVRQAREALNLSQGEFGDAIGLAQWEISRLEKGVKPLELQVAQRIVRLCRDHGVDRRLEDFLPPDAGAADSEVAA